MLSYTAVLPTRSNRSSRASPTRLLVFDMDPLPSSPDKGGTNQTARQVPSIVWGLCGCAGPQLFDCRGRGPPHSAPARRVDVGHGLQTVAGEIEQRGPWHAQDFLVVGADAHHHQIGARQERGDTLGPGCVTEGRAVFGDDARATGHEDIFAEGLLQAAGLALV